MAEQLAAIVGDNLSSYITHDGNALPVGHPFDQCSDDKEYRPETKRREIIGSNPIINGPADNGWRGNAHQ